MPAIGGESAMQVANLLLLLRIQLVSDHDQEVDVAVDVCVPEGERPVQVHADQG